MGVGVSSLPGLLTPAHDCKEGKRRRAKETERKRRQKAPLVPLTWYPDALIRAVDIIIKSRSGDHAGGARQRTQGHATLKTPVDPGTAP